MSYELIETVEVGSGGAASIEFTSIPQDGTDLVVKASLRQDIQGSDYDVYLNNSDTGFTTVYLRVTSTGSVSAGTQTNNQFRAINQNDTTANTFSNTEFYISNYTSTSNKSISYESVAENNGNAPMSISATSFNTSVGITSFKLESLNTAGFFQYSTASLYKITAA